VSFVRVAALTAVLVTGCAPSASAPTPTVSTAPAGTSPSGAPTASPAPKRIDASEAPYPAVAGAFLIFQLPSETRLRAVSFGGEVNGRLEGGAGQTSESAGWSQSPYGAPYLVGTTAFDRDGKPLGTVPWTAATASKTWSSDGRFLCAAVPASAAQGAEMRLDKALVGQPAKVITTGFSTYSNNAGYPVLACDEGTDRVIVAAFGQGIAPGRLWVFRLSTGAMIRSVDYSGPIADSGWVAASADGSMLAETVRAGGAGGPWKATIRATDDGAQLGTIDGFVVQGFSGDKTLVVGANETSVAVIEWKTGRKVWTTTGRYGGYLAEPAGRRIAVGVGFVGGSDQRDVYLVAPDGSAFLLPERVRVALRY
jgi:hypothetical protein